MKKIMTLIDNPHLDNIRRLCVWILSKLPIKALATIKPFGIKLHVDLASTVGRSIWLRGTYEPEITQCIKSIIQEGDVFFDVGANVGYFSMIASYLVGPSGKVVTFEPNPNLSPLLNKSITINQFKNIELIQKAVTADGLDVELMAMRNSGFSHIVASRKNQNKNTIRGAHMTTVPSMTLDEFVASTHDKCYPKLIKIDVEGAEMGVLKGAEKTLRQYSPSVLIEVVDWALARFGNTVQDIFTYLESLGYKAVNPETSENIEPDNLPDQLVMVLFCK